MHTEIDVWVDYADIQSGRISDDGIKWHVVQALLIVFTGAGRYELCSRHCFAGCASCRGLGVVKGDWKL